jgi:uncharacterized membrane protein (UPF0182 family)
MKRTSTLLLKLLVPVLLIGGIGFGVCLLFTDFVVDVLWYKSLGYLQVMFLKTGYKYLVFAVVTIVFFLIIFINFWIASRYLGVTMVHKPAKTKAIIRAFRSGSLKVYTPLSLILAIVLAMPLYQEWEKALLYFFAPDTGTTDSLFHLDVSFYLFALPVLITLQGRVMMTLLVMLMALLILYAAELKLLSKQDKPMFRAAKVHLSFVVGLIGLVQLFSYGIEALMLQYSTNNLERYGFYGPGFAEVKVGLSFLIATAVLVLLAVLCLIGVIQTRRGAKVLIPLAVIALTAHLCRDFGFIRNAVNKGLVDGQPITMLTPYIEQSIQSTLTGYQLQNVERRPFQDLTSQQKTPRLSEAIEWENIPLWDNELLGSVYEALQSIRPYYTFSGVDAARYRIQGELHQVYLAGRELDVSNLPGQTVNWATRHYEYTHGYGFVITPAAQQGEKPMQWYALNMPPESRMGFEVKEPSIYYGMADLPYSIAPNNSGEFHYPSNEDQGLIEVNYSGTGGVPVGSFWSRVLFGLYMRSSKFVLPSEFNADSRIHFRRQIQERVKEITPFLQLDQNPYLVVTPERLYWIQDAYTTSRWYPNSQPYEDQLNYIRNSVKIVTDAYDGDVTYYLSDPTDSIARAYQRMYPGLIKPLSDMPEVLREQIRYPRDLFEIQMRIYAKFQQTNPQTFFNNEDLLQLAEVEHEDTEIPMKPYYVTLDLIEPGKREFLLMTPMLPAKRQNLRALAVVGSDGDHYGKMMFYTFPKGSQVLGPSQVNAIIDSDDEIAEAMTLWNQQGSEVKRGKMIMLPVNEHILYIQPLYLESRGSSRIPQLKRVIVSADEHVVMDVSLENAVKQLEILISQDQLDNDLPPFSGEEDQTATDAPEAMGGEEL